MLFCCE